MYYFSVDYNQISQYNLYNCSHPRIHKDTHTQRKRIHIDHHVKKAPHIVTNAKGPMPGQWGKNAPATGGTNFHRGRYNTPQLLLDAIHGLQGTLEGVLERVTSLEDARSRSQKSPSPPQEHLPEHTGATTGDKDGIAARVTTALKHFGLDENETQEDIPTGGKNIHSSRKSGRTWTTEDLIVKYVHWPHLKGLLTNGPLVRIKDPLVRNPFYLKALCYLLGK